LTNYEEEPDNLKKTAVFYYLYILKAVKTINSILVKQPIY